MTTGMEIPTNKRFKNIKLGSKFGQWTVLNYSGRHGNGQLWECQCSCGKLKKVQAYSLLSGISKRCTSCKISDVLRTPEVKNKRHLNKLNKRPRGTSAFNILLGQYRHSAKSRNYIFALSIEDFKSIIYSNCHYCGQEPSQIIDPYNPEYGSLKYNGIDRKDNDIGYDKNNCVPCCGKCNMSKNKASYYEFKDWIKKVYMHFGGK